MRQPINYTQLPDANFSFHEMGEVQKRIQILAESLALDGDDSNKSQCLSIAELLGMELDLVAIDDATNEFQSSTEQSVEAEPEIQAV